MSNIFTKYSFSCESIGFRCDRHKKLAEKYFFIWKINTQERKKSKDLEIKSKIYDEKISRFVQTLSSHYKSSQKSNSVLSLQAHREILLKNSKNSVTGSIFESRLVTQKKVIEDQKEVISQQIKVIEELKWHHQTQILGELVIAEVERELGDINKPVVKCIPRPEDHPLLKKMKDREEERRQQRAFFEMKRKEKEKYLAEKLELEMEERRRAEVERKRQKARDRKEEKRRKEEEEKRRKTEEVLCRKLKTAAGEWADQLKVERALRLWKWRVERGKVELWTFKAALEADMLRRYLREWRAASVIWRADLELVAQKLWDRALLESSWSLWTGEAKKTLEIKKAVALWKDIEVVRVCFTTWSSYTKRSIRNIRRMAALTAIYESMLVAELLKLWKRMPAIQYERREREKRLRQWEASVRSLLPDYSFHGGLDS